jgi:hypothetical protein
LKECTSISGNFGRKEIVDTGFRKGLSKKFWHITNLYGFVR